MLTGLSMTKGKLRIAYRLATEVDRHVAEEDWLSSFRRSYYAGLCSADPTIWRLRTLPEIQRILDLPGVEIHVAFNPELGPETEADIYGWLAIQRRTRRPLVLYCYMKLHYRGWGIMRSLFDRVSINPWSSEYDYIVKTKALLEPDDAREPGPDGRPPTIEKRMRGAWWTPLAVRVTDYREDAKERRNGRRNEGHPGRREPPAQDWAEPWRSRPDPGRKNDR